MNSDWASQLLSSSLTNAHIGLLCALLNQSQNEPSQPWLAYDYLLNELDFFESTMELAATVKDLREVGFVSGIQVDQQSTNSRLFITPAGSAFTIASADQLFEQKEKYLDHLPEEWINNLLESASFLQSAQQSLSMPSSTPASDRYVRVDHNSPAYYEAMKTLAGLISEIEENRDNTFEDKEGMLAELHLLQVAFSQQIVCVPLVEKILRETVSALATRFVDQAIGNLANAVSASIGYLIGIS